MWFIHLRMQSWGKASLALYWCTTWKEIGLWEKGGGHSDHFDLKSESIEIVQWYEIIKSLIWVSFQNTHITNTCCMDKSYNIMIRTWTIKCFKIKFKNNISQCLVNLYMLKKVYSRQKSNDEYTKVIDRTIVSNSSPWVGALGWPMSLIHHFYYFYKSTKSTDGT